MTDPTPSTDQPLPTPSRTVLVKEELSLIEVSTYYRGKTNGYVVERTSILAFLDRSGRKIEDRWEEDWTEVAPGIETRRENTSQRWSVGDRSSELAKTGSVRIHRHACPVYVQFRNTLEYNDYDDSSFSTSDSSESWVRYEV